MRILIEIRNSNFIVMDEEFLEEVNIIHERKRGPIRSCLTNQKFLKGKQKGGALTYFPLLGPDNWRAFKRFFCFEEFGKGKINTIQLDQQVNFFPFFFFSLYKEGLIDLRRIV